MAEFLSEAATWLQVRGDLVAPLILTMWIAWGDIRTRRIPNYLILGTAVAGLACNLIFHGWLGLMGGVLGMLMGFGFLILPYLWGGMGAGDVKALAALGAWLGPVGTLFLFCYMGIAGGLMAVGVLLWKGLLWRKARQGWIILTNLILCRPAGLMIPAPPEEMIPGIPYGVAIAIGMVVVVGTGA